MKLSLTAVIFIAIATASCDSQSKPAPPALTVGETTFTTMDIDGCQYIVARESSPGGVSVAITHKQNCAHCSARKVNQ